MRVAILGTGNMARYCVEEFPSAGLDVVVITRSHKGYFEGKHGVVQRVTDYSSVLELVGHLKDCDAVVSTIADYSPNFATSHLNVLAAMKEVPKVKRFIVSEYAGNAESSKTYGNPFNASVIEALEAQDRVEWTRIGCGLYADYLFLSKNRYLPTLGSSQPLDLSTKVMKIPGDGKYLFSSVAIRDVARVMAHLLKSESKWRHFISVQSEMTSWNAIASIAKTEGGIPDLDVQYEDTTTMDELLATATGNAFSAMTEELMLAMSMDYTRSGAALLNQASATQDKADYFPNLHLRRIGELFDEVAKNPDTIL